MENLLLEIIANNPGLPIKTNSIIEVVEAVKEATGKIINFKADIIHYRSQYGQPRQRKLKNQYQVSING